MTKKGVFICWGIAIILMGAYVYVSSLPAPDSVIHPQSPDYFIPTEAFPLEEFLESPPKPSMATEATVPVEPAAEAPVIPETSGTTLTGRVYNVETDEGIKSYKRSFK